MSQLHDPILVMTDHTGNSDDGFVLTDHSKQLLTLARSLTDGQLIAMALNPAPEVDTLQAYGVDKVGVPELGDYSPRVPGIVVDALNACVTHYKPAAVLCVSNYRGREVAAGLSILQEAGAAVDVTQLHVEDGELIAGKAVLAGTWETTFHMTTGSPIIAVKTAGMPHDVADTPGEARLEGIPVDFRPASTAVSVVRSDRDTSAEKSLIDSAIVVCGGKGTNGDFEPIYALAKRLDAAVGTTRDCTDEGWIDRSAQIGQSGVTVAPQLYIGAGVSGDIHHVSGIRGAKTIIAINNDSEAPIFDLCDLGIVGDLHTVIPQILDELDK